MQIYTLIITSKYEMNVSTLPGKLTDGRLFVRLTDSRLFVMLTDRQQALCQVNRQTAGSLSG